MKKKLLFVFDHEYEDIWGDGLRAAIELLRQDFDVSKLNLQHGDHEIGHYDFVLGWGAFGSSVDKRLQSHIGKKGLCLGGYAPYSGQQYDILFYEVLKWSKKWLEEQGYKGKISYAFGVNTEIYKPIKTEKIWDYITVSAFSTWKRQSKLIAKLGIKMAVGQIQKGNLQESVGIIGDLMLGNVMISDMVPPETLAKMYNSSKTAYIPADLMGGGERAVIEACACGIDVEVEHDNPKLQELLTSPIRDEKYYYQQLKKGIESCI